MDLGLQGRTALVTGASVGIGRGIAEVLAQEGVRVALLARRAILLEQVAEEIVKMGGPPPFVFAADLADTDVSERVGTAVLRTFGRLDILVNNAGGSRPAGLETPDAVWDFDIVQTATGAYVFRTFVGVHGTDRTIGLTPLTVSAERGSLADATLARANADQVAKAAQVAWAKGLSREVGRFGITVNSVAPGRIMSEQIEKMYPSLDAREDFAAANIPLGYFVDPHDVGYTVAFLASSKARYITGSIIYVDGGYHRFSF